MIAGRLADTDIDEAPLPSFPADLVTEEFWPRRHPNEKFEQDWLARP